MQTDILVIGGGMSGLAATWQLRRAGVDALLIEARSRFGGRILTVGRAEGADCDLGPSWFWPGQPLLASLLNYFDIRHYAQFAEGHTLFQQPDGQIVAALPTSPMAGALRIDGGVVRLVDALVDEIAPSARLAEHRATALTARADSVIVDVTNPAGALQIQAKQIAVAVPPRLAASLNFAPELPADVQESLAATPTWMAGHAKFFAIYDEPFWRQRGYCGSAISRIGPLAEIHDASPLSGELYALFGFVGIDGPSRRAMGQEELTQRATAQLAAIFGDEANSPRAVFLQDWSREEFTAAAADQQPQTRHPSYGLDLALGDLWADRLSFIATETSFANGGLIEGALEAGLDFARRVGEMNLSLVGDKPISHTASMDWDWL